MKMYARYAILGAGVILLLLGLKRLVMPQDTSQIAIEAEKLIFWTPHLRNKNREMLGNSHEPGLADKNGRAGILSWIKARPENSLLHYNLNILASDTIALNRMVPDSRPAGCDGVKYPEDLPSTTVVIPFHNEWPSVLLRTVYSLINRTPLSILKQIILVDDASDLEYLKDELEFYLKDHFPGDLVRLVRMPERVGLIRARLEGFRHVTTEVVSFFDSHMEVNKDWLQPLLTEIKKDRSTIAMGHLDYILPDTFQYTFTPGYRTRYGFDWRLIFFETYFLKSQERGRAVTDPLPGVVMVGPAFAVNVDYFREIGTYDQGMKIWGGENLELAWRVWMCGGQLVHLGCSKIGHIARPQPYTFPEGRYATEVHNYKRAVDVWMGPYKKYVYDHHPSMKDLDVGDLSDRHSLRERMHCKNFTWFLKNVWPELYPYNDNATHWGGVWNVQNNLCLDNNEYLFLGPEPLHLKPCTFQNLHQGFSLTVDRHLRSVLQCVGIQEDGQDLIPVLITCQNDVTYTWIYTPEKQLQNEQSGLCLHAMSGPKLLMQTCQKGDDAQVWSFKEQGVTSLLDDDVKRNYNEIPAMPSLRQNEETAKDMQNGPNDKHGQDGKMREEELSAQDHDDHVIQHGPILGRVNLFPKDGLMHGDSLKVPVGNRSSVLSGSHIHAKPVESVGLTKPPTTRKVFIQGKHPFQVAMLRQEGQLVIDRTPNTYLQDRVATVTEKARAFPKLPWGADVNSTPRILARKMTPSIGQAPMKRGHAKKKKSKMG